jgi:hypothetical protein
MSVTEANKKTSEKINPILLCFTESKAAVGIPVSKAAHTNHVAKASAIYLLLVKLLEC